VLEARSSKLIFDNPTWELFVVVIANAKKLYALVGGPAAAVNPLEAMASPVEGFPAKYVNEPVSLLNVTDATVMFEATMFGVGVDASKFQNASVPEDVVAVPEPVTVFVELPPLLLNTTEFVNAPTEVGRKLIVTVCVRPAPTLYELPAVTANGLETVAVPVRDEPPVLMTENGWLLVWPTVTEPNPRLAGVTESCGAGALFTVRLTARVVLPTPSVALVNETVSE